jgi:hypothetical protein
MANNFQITITAIDRATAVVRRINAGMARITQPITNIRRAAGALAKELGFDKVGAAVGGVVKNVRQLGGQLASLLGPLAIIAGGGTLAGIAALATEWGRMGSEISRTASMLDMSAGKLQGLRGAGALAGVGAHELESGLKSLGDTMEDALYGRNQQALVVLNRLGVGIHKTKDGSIDAARGFRDLAGAIAATKSVQVQGLIARTFGLEAALPLLRKGPEAIEAYERKVASLGGIMGGEALAAAVKFKESLSFLDIAVQGVRNSIGEKLQPIIGPLIEQLTSWIAANRELISTKVAEFVQGVAQWISRLDFKQIGEQVRQFCADIETLVDKFGGWQNAAGAVVLAMNAGLLAGVINLGFAIGKLAVVSVPVLIRGFGLLAAATNASLIPAIVRGLTSAALYTAILADMAVGIPVVGSLLGGLSIAFASVGAAIAATPVGWLIAGAAAVAAAVYAIYKNWDNITAYFSEKFAGIKAAFQKNWLNGIVKALWEFSPVKILADAFNGLSKWLFDFDLYDAGKSLINRLIGGVKSVATMLPKSVLKFLGIEGWANSPLQVSATVAPAAGGPKSAPNVPTVQTSAQKTAASLGVRNNNPGNLRQWGDMPRDAKGYAMFPTADAGLAAAIKNLRAQQQVHGLNTIESIIGKWAPPSENDTGAYISDVVKRTGFGAKQRLNLDDAATVAPLISSIIKHEGNGAAYSDEMINKAVAAQLGAAGAGTQQKSGPQQVEMSLTLHGLPAGVTASAQTKGGQSMPVRVAYSMPTGITP